MAAASSGAHLLRGGGLGRPEAVPPSRSMVARAHFGLPVIGPSGSGQDGRTVWAGSRAGSAAVAKCRPLPGDLDADCREPAARVGRRAMPGRAPAVAR